MRPRLASEPPQLKSDNEAFRRSSAMSLKRLLAGAAAGVLLSSGAHAQTYAPSSGESPLVLLQVPKDGVAYYDARKKAEALWQAKKFAEAEPIAEQLVRDYPRDPDNWSLLGRVKRSLSKHAEAGTAFNKAGPLQGWGLQFPNGYRVATAHLRSGNKRAALDTLRWLIFEERALWRNELYDWPEYEPLRNDPEFLEMIGRPDTSGWSRDEGWGRDLQMLYDEAKRVNPVYRHSAFPAEVDRRFAALKQDIPTLSDAEILYRMKLMLAPLRQGHIAFWPLPASRFLPVRFYAFPQGVFIIDAQDKSLIGSRLVKIGTLSAEEAWRRLSKADSADGDMEYVWGVSGLAETANLQGFGAIRDPEAVELTLEPSSGGAQRQVTVATTATPPPNGQSERWDRLLAPPGAAPPLFLSRMKETFWQTSLPDRQALYVQINNLTDSRDETLVEYGRRLWTVVGQIKPKNLILDLRHNNGGVTQEYPELLRTIVAFSRTPGAQVYVLIGRRSYSATGNFITDLERLADPVFVGEASSECCNLHGDPAVMTLPYSKVGAELTAVKWQLSPPGDRRREMSPEVPVQLNASDYFAGRDPVLEAVYRLIDRG